MPAQYPTVGFPPGSEVSLLRRICNNTALMAESAASGPIWVSVPATSTSAGTAGQMAYDNDYLYVAVSANVWRRVAINDWA